MGLGPPPLFLVGPGTPLFNFEFFMVGLNNTIGIGSTIEVNRLMKHL